MNFRKNIYFFILSAFRGIRLGDFYDLYSRQVQTSIPAGTTKDLLIQLLEHCQKNVPYYANLMKSFSGSYHDDPFTYLRQFPILTKDIIRANFENLQSADLAHRKWFLMTSGGSTGEPGRVIQDYEFSARNGAIQLLFSRLLGRETGDCELYLWGSEKEIIQGTENWKARLANNLTNSHFFNAFRMTPETMLEVVDFLNTKHPKLIIAYAESIVGLAKYIEAHNLKVKPQQAIISSAETMYPFMREKIERVFQCKVYNRYGSREVGNIACERPGVEGLWVAPWGNYLEILDDHEKRVPDGVEGEIIITSLINYAMPLIRYRIDDQGIMLSKGQPGSIISGQVLKNVTGRVIGQFRTNTGARVNPGYLCGLLFYKDWVRINQIVQEDYSHIVFNIVLAGLPPNQNELNEIIAKTRLVFGDDCKVEFRFVNEIEASVSGKYHYTLCEVKNLPD